MLFARKFGRLRSNMRGLARAALLAIATVVGAGVIDALAVVNSTRK
jgi:hypothetical protein